MTVKQRLIWIIGGVLMLLISIGTGYFMKTISENTLAAMPERVTLLMVTCIFGWASGLYGIFYGLFAEG